MSYVSRQLVFKFACVVIASVVTFAGMLMSMDLLRQIQMPAARSSPSGTLHLFYQMEQQQPDDQSCIDCTFYQYSRGGNIGLCCTKRTQLHTRKWGPPSPPASRLVDDADSKVRMTPAAERNHPFLRRTPGIDYSKESNSTNYVYLYPDPIEAPSEAPEPAYALPPLFWDDYQNPENTPGEFPVIPTIELENPPMTDYDFAIQPPL